MRLSQQIVLFIGLIVALPVGVIGLMMVNRADRDLGEQIAERQRVAASDVAREFSMTIDEAVETLERAAAPLQWASLDDGERVGALGFLLRQSRHFVASALFDHDGILLAPIQRVEGGGGDREFVLALPVAHLAQAAPGAVLLSPAFARETGWGAALALRLSPENGDGFVAVELTFEGLQQRAIQLMSGGLGDVALIDGEDRVLAGHARRRLSPGAQALVDGLGAEPKSARYLLEGKGQTFAAAARTPDALRWAVLIELPETELFAPVRALRREMYLIFGAALGALVLAGLFFARRLAQRLGVLSEGARAVGQGNLHVKLALEGKDELAQLAGVFNAMIAELAEARVRLLSWNETLARQVEERTAELKQAQARLFETQKLAAIGQLGAGVAHELNTPLAGIIGSVQLLEEEAGADPHARSLLSKIEAQARRAKEITGNLLRFSESRPGTSRHAMPLETLAERALGMVRQSLEVEGIRVERDYASPPPVAVVDEARLVELLFNLLQNARTAMAGRAVRTLTVRTVSPDGGDAGDGHVLLEVEDTGKGIPEEALSRVFEPFFTTKEVWSNVGLGLPVAFRIAEEHGGHLTVTSRVGEGSRFTLALPAEKGA